MFPMSLWRGSSMLGLLGKKLTDKRELHFNLMAFDLAQGALDDLLEPMFQPFAGIDIRHSKRVSKIAVVEQSSTTQPCIECLAGHLELKLTVSSIPRIEAVSPHIEFEKR